MNYPWPSSALTPHDMTLLHRVRQHGRPRTPINKLIARAVRETYGRTAAGGPDTTDTRNPGAPCSPHNHKEAT